MLDGIKCRKEAHNAVVSELYPGGAGLAAAVAAKLKASKKR